MKKRLDKIIAVCGFGLLGHYIGLSPLRLFILRLLESVLPPMNNRHLPMFYTGLFGIAVAVPLGYLVFTLLLQKHPLAKYKKHYILGAISLFALPLLVTASFRIHAVNIVTRAENTTPTDITIISNQGINYWFTRGSGILYRSSVQLLKGNAALEDIGSAVRQLKIQSTIIDNNPSINHVMFIHYRDSGKWYSRILDYDGKQFDEDLGYQKFAIYEGQALGSIMQKLAVQLKDIKQYTQGSLIHSSWLSETDGGKKSLSQKAYQALVSVISDENNQFPNTDAAEYFSKLLQEGVPKENQDIYCFYITNGPASTMKLENFMLYSERLGILWFEGEYYKADLSSVITEVSDSNEIHQQ